MNITEKPWLFKTTWRALVALLFLGLTLPGIAKSSNESQRAVPAATKQKLAKVQIPFIANQGQADKEVKFYARTFAGTVFVTEAGELVYSLPKLEDKKRVNRATLKEELIGRKVTEVTGESQAITKLSYFKGTDRSKWRSNIPSYDTVSLGEVYKGIEVKLKASGNNMEKVFYVRPGAEPETIRIQASGGKGIRVSETGELEIKIEEAMVRFSKPIAFQYDGGKRQFVAVAYVVRDNEYGFKVGDYDRTKELIIDPVLAATFLGGNDFLESVRALALDGKGNVYVAGSTASGDFPGVGPGSADSTLSGGEAFVAKLDSDLSSIIAATFLGGSTFDEAVAVALDVNGNLYVAGNTNSSDFPGVGPGSADSTNSELGDEGFVAKLNSDLSSILGATLLGGSASEDVRALILDNTGSVYVAGRTSSSDFPGIGPGSADSTFTEEPPPSFGTIRSEGFVAKINSDLSSILAATFLGGSAVDTFLTGSEPEGVVALTLDSTGNIYVTGNTRSADFPGITPESADGTVAGEEGFVAKLNSDLSSIMAATFLGGSGIERVHALALDNSGNVYVAGIRTSSDFPGVDPGSIGFTFLAKLDSDLSSIIAATFLGGSELDVARALAVDTMGNVYVAGTATSSDFPGIGPGSADSTIAGFNESFVAKLNSDLSSILAATFLGGSGRSDFVEEVNAIALDSKGDVYVAGDTDSADFPGIGPGSADNIFAERQEGFVAKLDMNLSGEQQIVNDKVSFVVQSTSLNPNPVPDGPAGVFTITASLANTSTDNILEPINAIVSTLTNGNKLLSATEGDGGVGTKQAIDAGADDILIPNESATVQFRIGLANTNPFSFFVDVLGIVSGDD